MYFPMLLHSSLLAVILTIFAAQAFAQEPPTATDDDLDEVNAIRAELNEVDRLVEAYERLRDWNRDGLNTRIDTRIQLALKRLNQVAVKVLGDPEISENARLTVERLLERGITTAVQREHVLEVRAAKEREGVPKFENSPQADIARAFIDDLASYRKEYFELIADQLEIRTSVGMETHPYLDFMRERIFIVLEFLAGQVTLDAISLHELRAQLTDEPLDEDLLGAFGMVQAKQRRNLKQLGRIIDLAERVDLKVAEHRSLLLRERGAVGVELLQSDVFQEIWADQFGEFEQAFYREGPNLLFRASLFLIIMVTAWLLSRLVRALVGSVLKWAHFDQSVLIRDSLTLLSSILVIAAGLVIALATVGVSLGPIFAGIGVMGIILGLAVQDSLGNLAAGVMILITRPFDVNDHIKVAGADGLVKRMNWLATTIHTFDNQTLVVPNSRIWGDTIVNYTANRVRRVDIKITYAYSEDPDRVHAVLLDILQQHDMVLDKPEPVAHMVGMEDSALASVIKPWVKTENYWAVLWDLNRLVKKCFDAEGIEIPFPQRVVTLLSPDGSPLPLRAEQDGALDPAN